jgi:hypothetical protein
VRRGWVVLWPLLWAVGCSSQSTGPGPVATIEDMAGRWSLETWEAVSVADTQQRLDLKAEFNATATLEVAANGSATFTASVYGQSPTVQAVSIRLAGDTIVYHEITGDSRFLLGGTWNRMIWHGVVPQYEDVNGDGLADETRTWMTFVRL